MAVSMGLIVASPPGWTSRNPNTLPSRSRPAPARRGAWQTPLLRYPLMYTDERVNLKLFSGAATTTSSLPPRLYRPGDLFGGVVFFRIEQLLPVPLAQEQLTPHSIRRKPWNNCRHELRPILGRCSTARYQSVWQIQRCWREVTCAANSLILL